MNRFPQPLQAVLFLLAMGLAACTVGTDYQPPSLQTPESWSGEAPDATVPAGTAALARWWTLFGDPQLDFLLEQAVAANRDLRIAAARIREARARRGVTAADAWPGVDLGAAYERSRDSENSAAGRTSSESAHDLFQAGFDANWELDIFGRVKRAVEAAEATIGVAEENRRDVLVTLQAEVARNYLELRGSQRRIAATRENVETQRQTLALTQGRFAAGLSSRLDVAQAEAQLAATEAQIPGLETAARVAIHRLGVLTGQAPAALLAELSPDGLLPSQPAVVPLALPAELLRRRPDIRRAERELAASTALIGVAVADLFPRFSLSALLGVQSSNFSDLADGASGYWSFGPALRWPVFDAGRARANIRVQDARQEQFLAAYEQTVLLALEEVENALVAWDREQAARRALEQAVDANRRAVAMADELYRTGLVDFLHVLQSEGALYQSQDWLIRSEQQVFINMVALFKALGGGWEGF
jgi:NodT family efflux transporter outer membrane factor (OMF) lipoprotein